MSSKKLYVGNLNYRTTDQTLKDVFSAFGEVASANVLQGRGFGFVEMDSEEGARKAIDSFNGGELHGKVIVVSEARPPKDQPAGGGYGRDSRPRPGGFGRGPSRPSGGGGGGGRRY